MHLRYNLNTFENVQTDVPRLSFRFLYTSLDHLDVTCPLCDFVYLLRSLGPDI